MQKCVKDKKTIFYSTGLQRSVDPNFFFAIFHTFEGVKKLNMSSPCYKIKFLSQISVFAPEFFFGMCYPIFQKTYMLYK
jgi:hypothetical protein